MVSGQFLLIRDKIVTYAVWIRVGPPISATVPAVPDVSVVHILSSDFFLLLLGEGCFFMHPPAELVGSFSLGPIRNEVQEELEDTENYNGFFSAYFFLRLTDRFSKLKVSQMRSNLTFLSSGLSVPKEDKWFTSMSHGLSFWSIMTSMPRI